MVKWFRFLCSVWRKRKFTEYSESRKRIGTEKLYLIHTFLQIFLKFTGNQIISHTLNLFSVLKNSLASKVSSLILWKRRNSDNNKFLWVLTVSLLNSEWLQEWKGFNFTILISMEQKQTNLFIYNEMQKEIMIVEGLQFSCLHYWLSFWNKAEIRSWRSVKLQYLIPHST